MGCGGGGTPSGEVTADVIWCQISRHGGVTGDAISRPILSSYTNITANITNITNIILSLAPAGGPHLSIV